MHQSSPEQPVNLLEYEILARERLPKMFYDYYAGGSDAEITLSENRMAFERLQLLPRFLVDVSMRNLSTTVLGQSIDFPFLIAPTAFHRLATPEGELATAKAAADANTIMILSSLSNTPLEEVSAVTDSPLWFQLYVYKDRGLTRAIVERAEAAGYSALCLTIDAPLLGRRERDIRNQFNLPPELTLANVLHTAGERMQGVAQASALSKYFAELLDQSLTWDAVEWLQGITRLPVLLKGIHHPKDAELAVERGVPAIVVSNHGARQLDTVPATIDLLPNIVKATEGRTELLIDGGFRRGTDILKGLALGARAVLIGRPILWGLAVDGKSGVTRVLDLLANELSTSMALSGVTNPQHIPADLIFRPG
jgi:4-hydroxymandelate oxidase